MIVYFTKNDDLILFCFNMKKLNIFNFLHIKIMKMSFEIIRNHCFVLATVGNLQTYVCFQVNICLNKSLVQQNLKIVFEYWKIQKFTKYLTRLMLKLKMLNSQKLLLELLLGFLEPGQTFKMELSVKIVNSIKLLSIFTIVMRNGKIVWKVVWIEYYLQLNLSFRRYQYPGYLSIHQM